MNLPWTTDALLNWSWLIPAAPFIAGTLIIFFARFNKTLSMTLSVGAVFFSFLYSLLIFHAFQQDPTITLKQVNWAWFTSASFNLSMGVLVDHLCAIMMIVVTTVSLLVQIYTHGYMREDKGYSRFYAYLSLFTGSMLGLVVSTNLFEMYFFWELVGVCSYFLIGFWWQKNTAAEACLKAFVVNRIGDFGFLVGMLLLLAATYGFWGTHPLLMFNDAHGFGLTQAIKWASDHGSLTALSLALISIVMFMGPMAKSAQLPLHVWLADAMEGPTPISALIHAATMVAAGVYLVARAYPVWLTPDGHLNSIGLAVVAWVGTITAVAAALIALTQFDIKRVLAWSTVSQLGYMFAGLGCGAYTAGMFHLFNHAFFKAMLFLASGAIIHHMHHAMHTDKKTLEKLDQVSLMDRMIPPDQDIRNMGGLKHSLHITRWCFLIGTISISGVPFFSGFFSKDEIISSAFAYQGLGHQLIYALLVLTAGLTAFYMFRLYFLTFEGKYRGKGEHHNEKISVMNWPLVVLAVPSILSGYLGTNMEAFKQLGAYFTSGATLTAFPNVFTSFLHYGAMPEYEVMNPIVMIVSTSISFGGILLAYLVYMNNFGLNTWCEKNIKWLYNLSWNKLYFDNLYMAFTQKIALPLFKSVWGIVDMLVVDNIVNLSSFATVGAGEALRYSENGRGQWYALVIFAGVVVLGVGYFFLKHNFI